VIPWIGAPAATVLGGLVVSAVTLVTAMQVPAIPKFRWDEDTSKVVNDRQGHRPAQDADQRDFASPLK
jgi:hypothetical protein